MCRSHGNKTLHKQKFELFHWSPTDRFSAVLKKALWDLFYQHCACLTDVAPRAPSLTHQPKTQQKCVFVVAACASVMKPTLITVFPSFFHTGQLQFLQHQMQQQQMAMGTAAPQVGAPQQHTASQPRSKRKRSMPQPLPKSWKAQITLRTVPSQTQGHEWFILCSSSASLWRQKQCPSHVFF